MHRKHFSKCFGCAECSRPSGRCSLTPFGIPSSPWAPRVLCSRSRSLSASGASRSSACRSSACFSQGSGIPATNATCYGQLSGVPGRIFRAASSDPLNSFLAVPTQSNYCLQNCQSIFKGRLSIEILFSRCWEPWECPTPKGPAISGSRELQEARDSQEAWESHDSLYPGNQRIPEIPEIQESRGSWNPGNSELSGQISFLPKHACLEFFSHMAMCPLKFLSPRSGNSFLPRPNGGSK